MIEYYYALFAMFTVSLSHIFNKKLVIIDQHNALFLRYIMTSLVSLIALLFIESFFSDFSIKIVLLMLLGGSFGMMAMLFLFRSFDINPIAITLTIASMFPFIVMFLTLFVFDIYPSTLQIFIMMLIVFGISLTVLKREKGKVKYNLLLPLVTAIGWGVYNFSVYALVVEEVSAFSLFFYLEVVSLAALSIFIFFNPKIKLNKRIFQKNSLSWALIGALCSISSLIFMYFAYFKIAPSIVTSIVSAQLIVASLLSVLIFKEKLKPYQYGGICVVVLGLVLYNLI